LFVWSFYGVVVGSIIIESVGEGVFWRVGVDVGGFVGVGRSNPVSVKVNFSTCPIKPAAPMA
jgi:hypothetical protein